MPTSVAPPGNFFYSLQATHSNSALGQSMLQTVNFPDCMIHMYYSYRELWSYVDVRHIDRAQYRGYNLLLCKQHRYPICLPLCVLSPFCSRMCCIIKLYIQIYSLHSLDIPFCSRMWCSIKLYIHSCSMHSVVRVGPWLPRSYRRRSFLHVYLFNITVD